MHEFCAALGFDERSAVSAAEALRQGGAAQITCGCPNFWHARVGNDVQFCRGMLMFGVLLLLLGHTHHTYTCTTLQYNAK